MTRNTVYELSLSQNDGWYELYMSPPWKKSGWQILNSIKLGEWIIVVGHVGQWTLGKALDKLDIKAAMFLEGGYDDTMAVIPIDEMHKIAAMNPYEVTMFDAETCPTMEQLGRFQESFPEDFYPPWTFEVLIPILKECKSKITYVLNDGIEVYIMSFEQSTLFEIAARIVNELIEETTSCTARRIDLSAIEKVFDEPGMCIRFASSSITASENQTHLTFWARGDEGFTRCRKVEITKTSPEVLEWQNNEELYLIANKMTPFGKFVHEIMEVILIAILIGIPVGLIYVIFEIIRWMVQLP